MTTPSSVDGVIANSIHYLVNTSLEQGKVKFYESSELLCCGKLNLTFY